MALTQKQKKFIKAKVISLGSKDEVIKFYKRKSLVCEYAHTVAEKIYKIKNKKEK